tara:strand:- start:1198 stop:2625 length:1428 start_codon:yes stop_codon:yes gene_type:complete
MKKYLFISISIIFFVALYFIISSQIGASNKNKLSNILISYLSEDQKSFIKEKIFVFKNQKVLKKEIQNLNKELIELSNKNTELYLLLDVNKIPFEQVEPFTKIENEKNIIQFKKFTNKVLSIKKNYAYSSYIDSLNDNIFMVSADSKYFGYLNIEDLKKNKFDLNVIKTNFKDFINFDEFFINSKFGIKDILIHKNQMYVSFTNMISKDCFNTSILVSDLNLDFLKFEKFFVPKDCIKKENSFGWFNEHISGGRIFPFSDNKILFSTGSYQFMTKAQDKNSIFGKILSINIENKDIEIMSMGHRNVQGLYYDKNKNLIWSSEHGPKGGDEVNLNNLNEKNIEIPNYGWPISSYGKHYNDNKSLYEKAPLKKSHIQNGFIEPKKYYVPSIGISEIIKVVKKQNTDTYRLLVSSLGHKPYNGSQSLILLEFDNNFNFKGEKIFTLGERVRDIIYLKKIDKFLAYLETSSSLILIDFK